MSRVTVADDVTIYCQDLGDGPAVVLIHGGCMSHRVWEAQVNALLAAGYRVVTPDLRGHGSSDKPVSPYTAEMYADDVAILTDALDVPEFTLVGWSLGATIAATFATNHGDRLNRLVLTSSSIFEKIVSNSSGEDGSGSLPLDKILANQKQNRPRGMDRFVSGMFGSEVDERMIQWLWSIGMQTPMRVAIKTLEIYADPEVERIRKALASLEAPSAVFHGVHDGSATVVNAESIAADVLSDGRFVPFEDSGHVPFLEETTRFNDELIAFLDG